MSRALFDIFRPHDVPAPAPRQVQDRADAILRRLYPNKAKRRQNTDRPATVEEIAQAEQALGRNLPRLYREMLLTVNGGVPKFDGVPVELEGISGIQPVDAILGVGSGRMNLLSMNGNERVPEHFVVFAMTGVECYCVDYHTLNDDQEPTIARYDMECDDIDDEPATVFPSFQQFLEAFVNEDDHK